MVPAVLTAAPYAGMVIDARTGEVLYAENADTRLHPASLTKMMTLYIAFEAVEHGEVSLDDDVTISANAASEPPSKLGMKTGQKIKLRYLIRAAAVKSANDAATAIGEHIEGSEAAFARRMNRTALALGMTRTTFKNANGLTQSGHLSTARDMTTLGRHIFYDYPGYYNLFSRVTTSAGTRQVANTNRRLLSAYRGADGIKTGYTRDAGYNLVASAERGGERVIATVFGGKSTASRNAQVAKLLDLGFSKAPTRVAVRKPALPDYSGKGIRVATAVGTLRMSPVPRPRPAPERDPVRVAALEEAVVAAAAQATVVETPAEDVAEAEEVAEAVKPALLSAPVAPRARPAELVAALELSEPGAEGSDVGDPVMDVPPGRPEVVTRMSTSGGQEWGITLGRYNTRGQAEKALLTTALTELTTLESALRKVVQSRKGGYEANFVGLTAESADMACRRLTARALSCETIGPS